MKHNFQQNNKRASLWSPENLVIGDTKLSGQISAGLFAQSQQKP